MKCFSFVVLICIFQTIHFSFACYGNTIELVEVINDPKNNVKFEKDVFFEMKNNCKVAGYAYLTIDRPFTSALLSVKATYYDFDLFTLKNVDLWKFVTDYNVVGLNSTTVEAGRIPVGFGEIMDFSDYGPFLGLFAGNITILIKAYIDGDVHNPDKFALVVSIKSANETPPLI